MCSVVKWYLFAIPAAAVPQDVNCKRPNANLWVLMCQLSFRQLHMDFISWLKGTYYSISPAGGISSRKCEMGNADKSQIPRGSLEFVQMKCDKGSLKHPSLALCNRISLEQGGAPGWIGGGMCLWMPVPCSYCREGKKKQSRRSS